MKIVIFISSLKSGGAERVAANLANYWVNNGWEITLVTLESPDKDSYILNPAIRHVTLGLIGDSGGSFLVGLWQNLLRTFALRRVLKQVRPQIALSMMNKNNVVLAFAAQGIPNLITVGSERVHPPWVPLGCLWELLRRISYGQLSAVTALTNESAAWLEAHTNASCVPVIPNPAVWPLPIQPPAVEPSKLLPAGKRILLAVGRLCEQKQFDHLIDAFRLLAPNFPQWLLVILGDGPLRNELESSAQKHGLGEQVFFPGRVGNVGDWYKRADIYVMSSRFEGFPNTLLEAMAHGLPTVSYDCDTGPRELIHHDVDGILVPADNLSGLREAINRLMGDDELRAKFSTRAVEVRERLSLERISGLWHQLFKNLQK